MKNPPPDLVDLDVAPDQHAWPVRVSRSLDAEAVPGPGLAAIVDIDGERLRCRYGRPDHGGHAPERGVLTSRCRRAGSVWAADVQSVNRLGLYPHVHRMVVEVLVPSRRAARRHEAIGGLRFGG